MPRSRGPHVISRGVHNTWGKTKPQKGNVKDM